MCSDASTNLENPLWRENRSYILKEKFTEMLKHADLFPALRHAVSIALSLPTSTAERLFSTLRRVETWLRSPMSDERLSGLCMMSVHREKINKDEQNFVGSVINRFGRDP